MSFTPLHRALGLRPSTLIHDMICSAVTQQVTEKSDLDWKEKLPDSRHPNAGEEFAKDIAAMVNGGGGMIVYGVAEDRNTSAAKAIVPIEEWTDSIERKLQRWAYSLIQPPVHGLEFIPIDESAGGARVIALTIPASLDTPHFAKKGDAFTAPRRYGAQTVFMSERDIEQAYRTRFEDRRNNDRSLSDLLDQMLTGVVQNGIWAAAAARPLSPRPAYTGRIKRGDAHSILDSLIGANPFLKNDYGFSKADPNPRPGYRKWRSAGSNHEGKTVAVVDIHDDGSVSLAHKMEVSGDEFDSGTDVHPMDAQQISAHIVHLIRALSEQLDMTSDYEISIVLKAADNRPIFIRSFGWGSSLLDRDETNGIHKFQPVTGILAANISNDEALQMVRSLALDVMNQGGSPELGKVYLKKEI